MLRFTEQNAIPPPTLQNVPPTLHTGRRRNPSMVIVGQEKDSVILVAREDYDENGVFKTYLDYRDLWKNEVRTIYIHDTYQKIVSASVNPECTVLAFTVKKTKAVEPQGDDTATHAEEYVSYIAEIQPQRGFFDLNIRRRQYQRIQFLHFDKTTTAHNRESYFLFFLDKDRIELYTIRTEEKKTKAPQKNQKTYVISGQPDLVSHVCNNFLWFEWIPQQGANTNLLYTLSHTRNRSVNSFYDCIFRCYSFKTGRKETLWEYQLSVKLPQRVFNTPSQYLPFSWRNASSSPDASIYFHVVMLESPKEKPRLVLCQQHIPEVGSSTDKAQAQIEVSLYSLSHKIRMDCSIHLNTARVTVPRVFFGTVNGLLVLYLPNHFVHFVDCYHPECPEHLLGWTGTEQVPRLPTGSVDSTSEAGALIVPLTISKIGSVLVDLRKLTFYSYDIDETVLLKWFQHSDKLFVPALHIAIHHLTSSSLVADIIRELCSNSPQLLSSDVFTEYLLGTTYTTLKDLMEDSKIGDINILSVIPSNNAYLQTNRRDCTRRQLMGLFVQGNQQFTYLGDRKEDMISKRLVLPNPNYSTGIGGFPLSAIGASVIETAPRRQATPIVVSAPIGTPPRDINLFKYMKHRFRERVEEGATTYLEIIQQKFEEYVNEQLSDIFRGHNSKLKVAEFAKLYRSTVENQSATLFDLINNTVQTRGKAAFQLLEHLYRALEDLSFPPPPGFTDQFAELGFQCLSRKMFMQFVTRGVFQLSVETVRKIHQQLDDSTEDQDFAFRLVTAMKPSRSYRNVGYPWKDHLKLLEESPSNVGFLLQYHYSMIGPPQGCSPTGAWSDDEELVPPRLNTYAAPLDLLLQGIAKPDSTQSTKSSDLHSRNYILKHAPDYTKALLGHVFM